MPGQDRPTTASYPADRESASGCLKGIATAVLAVLTLAAGLFASEWLFSKGRRPTGGNVNVEVAQPASPSPYTFTGYVLDYEKRLYYNLLVLTDETGMSGDMTGGGTLRLEVECRFDSNDTSPFGTTRGEKVTVVGVKAGSDKGRVTVKNPRIVPNP